jgi:hypothetical protein
MRFAKMSIRFSCELTDPDTEALLGFLLDMTNNDCDRMLEILDCAKEWIKLDAPIPSHSGDAHKSSLLHVVIESDEGKSSSLSQTPSQSLES